MNGTQEAIGAPPRLSTSLRLVCTEVWGGNRLIDVPVELPGVRGQLYSRPCAGGRGGDVHYLSVCDSGLISRICVADVAGHGEAVSTVSTEIHGLVRRHINWLDQRRVLKKLNKRLVKIGFDALTTAAAITYFPPMRRLSVSYAGHPPAWLYRSEQEQWGQLPADSNHRRRRGVVNLPLAVEADTTFTRRTLRVAYGDRLLVLTDGVLEAPDASGELFGVQRLEELLNERRHASTAEIAEAIIAALVARVDGGSLSHDDVTLLLVEFVPGPAGPAIWHAIRNRLVHPHGNSDDALFNDPRDAAGVPSDG